MSGRPPMVIATCNAIAQLPPELRRRFSFGTFFFDIPDAESNYADRSERDSIWQIYLNEKFGKTTLPDDKGWTGAEIRNCVIISSRLNITLEAAADFIVPVSISAAEQITKLREQATGKFISASHPGVYGMEPKVVAKTSRSSRAFKNQ